MKEIVINDKISYIEASEAPLCADIGIIREKDTIWLFDIGCGESNVPELPDHVNVVLSHFHKDHTGNAAKIPIDNCFVSQTTYEHVHMGTIVRDDVHYGNLHIFPLPSSHCKGCLGLEVDETYAFVGDALYSRYRDGYYVFNATLLKDELEVLKRLKAEYLLVSHHPGLIRPRAEVIRELEELYSRRIKGDPDIRIPAKI